MSVLTITKTTVMTNATASDSKYKYTVTYQVTETSKTLESVNVAVNDVSNNSYIGNMSYNVSNSNKNISANENADIDTMSAMFTSIIEEIKNRTFIINGKFRKH